MKTLFIVAESQIEDHVGEEYDYVLEVTNQPTTENIKPLSDRIRTRIRSLWNEGTDESDKKIVCYLDAASPFNTMLIDLKNILREEEGIEIELGYETNEPNQDEEAQEILSKIGKES